MPMVQSQPDALARMYATSIFELAQESGDGQQAAEHLLGELEEVLEIARSDARFGEFLSQILSVAARRASLDRIFKGRVSDLTYKFLQVLNDKSRLSHLPAIVAALDQQVQAAFGRIEVDVYTAGPITPDELATVKAGLQRVLGKEPVVHPYTDATMIGGLKIQIGDQLLDASIATRLRKLRDKLVNDGGASIRAAAERLMN
jgi:F-type H+-transporting ATPase subunit delta